MIWINRRLELSYPREFDEEFQKLIDQIAALWEEKVKLIIDAQK
jgi:hypothetical protein